MRLESLFNNVPDATPRREIKFNRQYTYLDRKKKALAAVNKEYYRE